MAALQPILKNNDKMQVHLDMYSVKAREGAISALKQMYCTPTEDKKNEANLYGLQGSFRKLQVD